MSIELNDRLSERLGATPGADGLPASQYLPPAIPVMELLHKILKTAVAGGASDVHLKTGTPVVFRINRELLAIECPSPTEEWMNRIVENVAPAHLKTRLEDEREIDFSYFVPGKIGRASCRERV